MPNYDPNGNPLPAPGSFFTPQQNWAENKPSRPLPTRADFMPADHPENTGYGLFSPPDLFAPNPHGLSLGNIPGNISRAFSDIFADNRPENTGYGMFPPPNPHGLSIGNIPGNLQRAFARAPQAQPQGQPQPGMFEPNPNELSLGNIGPNLRSYFSGWGAGATPPAQQPSAPGGPSAWNQFTSWLGESPASRAAAGAPQAGPIQPGLMSRAWNWLNESPNSIASAHAGTQPQAQQVGQRQAAAWPQFQPSDEEFNRGFGSAPVSQQAMLSEQNQGILPPLPPGGEWMGRYGNTDVYGAASVPGGRINRFSDEANIGTLSGGRAARLPAPGQMSEAQRAQAASDQYYRNLGLLPGGGAFPGEGQQPQQSLVYGWDGKPRMETLGGNRGPGTPTLVIGRHEEGPQGQYGASLPAAYMSPENGGGMGGSAGGGIMGRINSIFSRLQDETDPKARRALAREAKTLQEMYGPQMSLAGHQYSEQAANTRAQMGENASIQRAALPWMMGPTPEQQLQLGQHQAQLAAENYWKGLPYRQMTAAESAKANEDKFGLKDIYTGEIDPETLQPIKRTGRFNPKTGQLEPVSMSGSAQAAAPSQQDLEFTAKKYGMTVDQVKQRLGMR